MTNDTHEHPEKEQLLAFGLGKLGADEAERIAQHLDRCHDCSETIVNLEDDTFVAIVRRSPSPPSIDEADPHQGASLAMPPEMTIDLESGSTGSHTSSSAELPPELRDHPRYAIAELIGRGGMGDVYKAQHKVMNRPVALKVIKPVLVQNETAVRRFHREVQAAARLHHGNIVAAYDAEQAGNLHFLVMEFVDGVNLDQVVRQRGALPVEVACDYVRQAAAGLQHAHTLGMVHRDIKPHNLMVTAADEVKILDFGLASFVSELAADEPLEASGASAVESSAPRHTLEQLTQMGSMMGTPDYIAPEQAADAHTADIRADIYSLGCTFYTLLAGKAPFGEGSVIDKIKAHSERDARPLAEFRGDVPAEVEAIVKKMLAKNPADRYQTPGEVVEAIGKRMPLAEKPTVQLATQPVRARVRPRALVATALVFLAAIVAAVVFYIQTDNGVVRVEVVDESLQVTLNGRTIAMKDGAIPLTIRAGAPKLVVRRGDFEFETDSFQLRRGDKVALKVELIAGEIVVSKDAKRFGVKPLPVEQRLIPSIADGNASALGLLLRDRSRNLRQIGGALLEYQQKHGSFPPAATQPTSFDATGRPHLSWRVHLLPFLGQQKLFQKFRLNEPWDSEHNKLLLAETPDVYKSSADPTRTQLLAVVGKGTAYQGQAGLKLSDFHDGTSFTAYVVDAGPAKAVPWTKPEDLPFDAADPIRAFGKSDFGDEFIALLADSSLKAVRYDTAPEALRALFTRAAGDTFDALAKRTTPLPTPASSQPPPLSIGMNDEFGMLFEGRLVAPAELSRLLREALKENPDREVVIDLPKKPWTVAGHVDQLEQIARITGAKWITRPAWSQIRIVFRVDKSGQRTLDIQGPGYSTTGLLKDSNPNVREVIAKNPTLPVLLELAGDVKLADPRITLPAAEVNSAAEKAGTQVRVVRTRPATETAQSRSDDQAIRELHRLQGHTGSIERLAFIDNARFVSAGLQGEEYVWDARQGKRIRALTEHDRLVTAVAAAPAAGLFATGDSYGQIRLWNKDLTITGTVKGPERMLVTLAMSADGSLLMSSGASFSRDPALLAKELMPHIWNTRTRELVRTLDSKSGLIMAAAFTRDGKRLVTGGMAKHLSVWDVATGELRSTIELGMEVRTLSLSPDGRLAAVASSDPVVIVDLQTKEVTHRFNGHTLRVQSVAFLPDGRHVVSGSQDKTWRVWSLAESREVAQVAGTTPHTQTLAVSPDGKLVAGGGGEPYDHVAQSFPKNGDYDLRVWELPESLWPIEGDSTNRIVVEISADGQFRLAGRPISTIQLANRLKGMLEEDPEREVHVIPAERFRGPPFQGLLGLVRSAGAKNVTWPGSSEAIDAQKLIGKWRVTVAKGQAWMTFAEFKADGKLSFTGQEEAFAVFGTYQVDGNKLLLKMKTVDNNELDEETTILKLTDDALTTRSENGKELTFERVKAESVPPHPKPNHTQSLVDHKGPVIALHHPPFSDSLQRVHGEGNFLLSLGRDVNLFKWPATKLTQERSSSGIESAGEPLGAADLSADGKLAAVSWPQLGMVEVWTVLNETGTSERQLTLREQALKNVEFLGFSPDGERLFTVTPTTQVLWSLADGGKQLRTFHQKTTAVAFSADGKRLAVAQDGSVKSIVVLNIENPDRVGIDAEVARPTPSPVGRLAFSADGRRLALGQDDGTVTVVELPSKKILQTVKGNKTVAGAISHLEFSGGDRLLVVGVGGQLVQFWNWQANELLYGAIAPAGSARQVCLSPDGRRLFAAGGEAVSPDALKLEPTNDFRIYVWDLPQSVWPN